LRELGSPQAYDEEENGERLGGQSGVEWWKGVTSAPRPPGKETMQRRRLVEGSSDTEKQPSVPLLSDVNTVDISLILQFSLLLPVFPF
jgi:hypothetical protein